MSKVANIKFNGGIIHTPSDVSPIDGDLNECINLVPSDGELKPVEMPVIVHHVDSPTNHILSAIHVLPTGKMFVFVSGRSQFNSVIIEDEDGNYIFSQQVNAEKQEIPQWVKAIGNITAIGTSHSIYYIIYRDGNYIWLGDDIPRPVVKFEMELDVTTNELGYYAQTDKNHCIIKSTPDLGVEFTHHYSSSSPQTSTFELKDYSHRKNICDNFLSKIAWVQNKAKQKNQFLYPFFVRYAVKLYDGTYIMHSMPLLMTPSTDKCPICASFHETSHNNDGYTMNLFVTAKPSRLKYQFMGFYNKNNELLNQNDLYAGWFDIIKGVDVFMSSQIPTWNEGFYDDNTNVPASYKYARYDNNNPDDIDYGKAYTKDTSYPYKQFWQLNRHPHNLSLEAYFPIENKDNVTNLVAETGIFYKAKELLVSDLKFNTSYYFDDNVDYGTLLNLETKQTLPDEFRGFRRRAASSDFIYNNRLTLGNIKIEEPFWYPDATHQGASSYVVFVIKKTDKTIYIACQDYDNTAQGYGHYIYYPDPDCAEIIYNGHRLPMRKHENLNGAYFASPHLYSMSDTGAVFQHYPSATYQDQSIDCWYYLNNVIAMSNVANPFVFTADNMVEIGRGTILGINSTSIPMSEGQYGQYPLIVFTDSGVHAIGIANDGTFTGISPVSSADTLIGIPEIGQPNMISDGQSLYFITKRGLMEMKGLQVRCVSEVLNGRTWKSIDFDNCTNLNQGTIQYKNIVTMLGDGIKTSTTFNQTVGNNKRKAFLAFDYKHNRIIVVNPTLKVHWLYSISDQKWSKMVFNDNYSADDDNIPNVTQLINNGLVDLKNPRGTTDGRAIEAAVFNWSESYIQTPDREIWDLMGAPDENNDQYYKYGFIATRPIRLGSDEHKSIMRLLHRKRVNSQYGFVGMRLYGSVDSIKFYEITSLRGVSYKYFVVLLYTCMKANERYSYMSVEFEERFQNKLR